PVTGEYWLDLNNNQWNRWSGSAWAVINRTFVGIAVCDDTDCIVGRSEDFYALYRPDNSVEINLSSTEIARMTYTSNKVSVAGFFYEFDHTLETWNITNQLATSADMYDAAEQASRHYYYYIKDDGDCIISDISPYWRPDLFGWYMPHNPWRCCGAAFNNSGNDLEHPESFKTDRFANLPNYDLATSGTNWTSVLSTGRPYMSKNSSGENQWRIKFMVTGTVSVAAASLSLTVTGIIPETTTDNYQAIAVQCRDNRDVQHGFASPISNILFG
ncbi:unnamed protein product, partial [marine sediment metagenome]